MAGLLDMLRGNPDQPAPPQQQAAPSAPAAPSRLEGLMPILNDVFTGLAMGSNNNDAIAKAGMMLAQGNQTRRSQRNQNQTVKWLQSQGVGEAEASYLASDPVAFRAWYGDYKSGNQPDWQITDLFDEQGRKIKAMVDKKTGKYNQIGGAEAADPNGKLTTDQREYQMAREQGFEGSFMDYQIKMKEAGRNQVNIDTGVKLPSGFRWIDPNKQDLGVEPIPGGPGAQIPGELAARIGMADSFLGQFDKLRSDVEGGKITGPIDRFKAGTGRGPEGETYRQIQSGVDALMRLLTGAGMNQTEAAEYANRYLPSYTDNAQSAASKLDQLKRELMSAKDMAMRGRGGAAASPGALPAPVAPTQQRLKFNPATGELE